MNRSLFEDLEKVQDTLDRIIKAYEQLQYIDDEISFMSAISSLIDQWAADHDMTGEQLIEMKAKMVVVGHEIISQFGMMDKTGQEE